MDDREPLLSLEDLVQIVCEGNVDGELQERLTEVLRTDPRFAEHFEELETMAAEAGADDLWEGPAQQAVYAVAEALCLLSQRTADKVVAEVRSKYWEKDQ